MMLKYIIARHHKEAVSWYLCCIFQFHFTTACLWWNVCEIVTCWYVNENKTHYCNSPHLNIISIKIILLQKHIKHFTLCAAGKYPYNYQGSLPPTMVTNFHYWLYIYIFRYIDIFMSRLYGYMPPVNENRLQ